MFKLDTRQDDKNNYIWIMRLPTAVYSQKIITSSCLIWPFLALELLWHWPDVWHPSCIGRSATPPQHRRHSTNYGSDCLQILLRVGNPLIYCSLLLQHNVIQHNWKKEIKLVQVSTVLQVYRNRDIKIIQLTMQSKCVMIFKRLITQYGKCESSFYFNNY